MEPRAAVGDYDSGTDTITLYTTSQNPHVARLVLSAFVGIAPEHKLRVIAPDVGGGFGSKIFIYPEETVCALGGEEDQPAGQVDRGAHRGVSRRRARPRSRHPRRDWRSTQAARSWHARAHDRQSRRLHVDLLVVDADHLYAPLLSGQYDIPAIYARSTRSTPTPRRSTPIAARGGRKRPTSSSAWSRSRRARPGVDPAEIRRQNFVTSVPASDAGHPGL